MAGPAVEHAGVPRRRVSLSDRLLPWSAPAVAVLLVASLSAAVALPRHLEAAGVGALPSLVAAQPGSDATTDIVGGQLTDPSVEPVATTPVDPASDPASDPVDMEAAAAPAGTGWPDASTPATPPVDAGPSTASTAAPPASSPASPPVDAAGSPTMADPDAGAPEGDGRQGEPGATDAPSAPDEPPTAVEEPPPPAGPTDSERLFAEEFPVHAAARQTDDPATHGWALLVGVNRYQGRTRDTFGSVADVVVLREVLLAHGWRDDHILVLSDEAATHDRIVRGFEWLMRATDDRSTAVVSFSGHMRHRDGVTALWPTDSRYIWAADLGRMLGAVPAGRLWASLQGCHSEGLRAPGLEGPGRVITYSSRTVEKSYEDPDVGHSVQGYYLFADALRAARGDADGDGRVSIQEAYGWAAPRARIRTSERQSPLLADQVGEPFHLHLD